MIDANYPTSWETVPLAQILSEPLRNGHSSRESKDGSGVRTLTLTSVTMGDFSERNTKLTVADPVKVADLWLRSGDILVERSNTPELVGTARLYSGPERYAIFPDLLIRVRVLPPMDAAFLTAFLQSIPVRRYFQRAAQGIAGSMPKISQGTIEALEVPVPPAPEQHRVVGAIDSYFTRLDDAVANLERVQRNLKRYRASVLKAAVEGRLVPIEAKLARAERREYEPASLLLERILAERRRRCEVTASAKRPATTRSPYRDPEWPTIALPNLPEGWCWASVEQLEAGDRRCGYGVLVPGPDDPAGIPLVRVGDINDGVIDTSEIKRISGLIADTFAKTYLRGGEILLTLVGTIGRSAVVPSQLAGANIARAVGMLPVSDLVVPEWIECWFRSPIVREQMIGKAHEVARKTLNLEDVRSAPVALPPLAEQIRIVERLRDVESIVEHISQSVTKSEARLGRLRQSVLKQAFEGRLVDQDSADESASTLLERIKASRQVASTSYPTRTSRKKAAPA